VVSRITIEHEDGQVVTVQFGPERKVGPFHVSDGERVPPAKETGGALTFGNEPVGRVNDWKLEGGTGGSMTDDEVAALLDEPEVVEAGKEYYCAVPGVKCRVRVNQILGNGYLVERVTQPGREFFVGRTPGMLKAYPADRTGDLLTQKEIADLLSNPEPSGDDLVALKPEGEAAQKDIKPVTPPREKKSRRSVFEPKKEPIRGWDAIIKQWMAWVGTREGRTLNYSDFAKMAGINVADLSKYRRNVKTFTEFQQEKFAKALGVTVEQFQSGPANLPDEPGKKPAEPKTPNPPVELKPIGGGKKDPGAIVVAAGTTVAAICAACRNEEFGEKKTCVGCALIKFRPTDPDTDPEYKQITSAAKAHICLHCVRKNRGQCDICILTAAIEAENLIAAGASLTAAVDMAADNYTSAMERIAERFDERAGR